MPPEKVGRDVLYTPPKYGMDRFFTNQHSRTSEFRQRILDVLNLSERPLNISELTRACGIKSWMTTKQLLVDLEAEGRVEHFKSGQVTLFRAKKSKEKRVYRIPRLPGQITPT